MPNLSEASLKPSWSADSTAQLGGSPTGGLFGCPASPPTAGGRPQLLPRTGSGSYECRCCKPIENIGDKVNTATSPVLRLAAEPEEVLRADEEDVAAALQSIFGPEGLQALFGRCTAQGAKRLHCGGYNHVFMVELGGRLAKCIRPHGGAGGRFSEAGEAERLRRQAPGLPQDTHAVFPTAAYLCRRAEEDFCCEVLVFEYIKSCQSIGDLFRSFERTHPHGILRQGSSCKEHRADEAGEAKCSHARALLQLVRQAARLGRRFQSLHGRRHGDFKADNVLVDLDGRLRLSDFLSPFCTACDVEEFQTSLKSAQPLAKELQSAFESEWLQATFEGRRVSAEVPSDLRSNKWLAEELTQLVEATKTQPLFGPVPDLLGSLTAWQPGTQLTSPNLSPGASQPLESIKTSPNLLTFGSSSSSTCPSPLNRAASPLQNHRATSPAGVNRPGAASPPVFSAGRRPSGEAFVSAWFEALPGSGSEKSRPSPAGSPKASASASPAAAAMAANAMASTPGSGLLELSAPSLLAAQMSPLLAASATLGAACSPKVGRASGSFSFDMPPMLPPPALEGRSGSSTIQMSMSPSVHGIASGSPSTLTSGAYSSPVASSLPAAPRTPLFFPSVR
eukprot:TRINITY_DN32320_c0_g1_i1.p1 TRINITY_DN32320_c0_g1~~TRINITY_DN32320_c0_g1_i1.p1  ORF type:complete len:726 (+),score=143.98 TRINITY_DN32320_c0_g1_i1:319-2178(+)